MYGYVYLTTNLVNFRKYIGKHRSSKFTEDYLGSGKILKQAVDKYGFSNFKVELIEECNSKEELDKREIYWIKYYNAVESEEFYNLGKGGEGWQVTLSGENHPMYGLKGADSPIYGHEVSQETREKIRNKARNRVWICNEEINKEITVDYDAYQEYISSGWKRGRLKSSTKGISKTRIGNKFSDNKGRIWVNNGEVNKMIRPEEILDYESKGWVRGSLSKSTKGYRWYNNGVDSILLSPDEQVPEGYLPGCAYLNFNGENNPFYGKHHSEESIQKMLKTRNSNKVKKNNLNFNWRK